MRTGQRARQPTACAPFSTAHETILSAPACDDPRRMTSARQLAPCAPDGGGAQGAPDNVARTRRRQHTRKICRTISGGPCADRRKASVGIVRARRRHTYRSASDIKRHRSAQTRNDIKEGRRSRRAQADAMRTRGALVRTGSHRTQSDEMRAREAPLYAPARVAQRLVANETASTDPSPRTPVRARLRGRADLSSVPWRGFAVCGCF